MYIIGIDPGSSSGHLCTIHSSDTGTNVDVNGKPLPLPSDLSELAIFFRRNLPIVRGTGVYVFMEKVDAHRPPGGPVCQHCRKPRNQQGIASTAKFIRHAGWMEGMLSAMGIDWTHVRPAVWQKSLGCLTAGDKHISQDMANKLSPSVAFKWTLKNSDAFLIAYYGLREMQRRERMGELPSLSGNADSYNITGTKTCRLSAKSPAKAATPVSASNRASASPTALAAPVLSKARRYFGSKSRPSP